MQRKINLDKVDPFKSLMAAWKKLFLSQLVRDLRLFVSFSQWKKVEERMSGVRGVPDYAGGFSRGSWKCR